MLILIKQLKSSAKHITEEWSLNAKSIMPRVTLTRRIRVHLNEATLHYDREVITRIMIEKS